MKFVVKTLPVRHPITDNDTEYDVLIPQGSEEKYCFLEDVLDEFGIVVAIGGMWDQCAWHYEDAPLREAVVIDRDKYGHRHYDSDRLVYCKNGTWFMCQKYWDENLGPAVAYFLLTNVLKYLTREITMVELVASRKPPESGWLPLSRI